ncbi:hypothetical protein ACFOQM_12595 [Paenibacillus sp. GCM10012307]|uniref:Uncharacterized protein n=1 Tax=Paenibacillus roseus TaxID=2798579 RepID=A0A934IZK5_9BACL|nr:hypothetical protein [Paenibacillus roseus]MBJ6362131.1 hypothetical protein [Paenibacillus roseus]
MTTYRAYIIRFQHPERGAGFAEIVAATEAEAREDFEHRYPGYGIISSHPKPIKP